MATLEDVRRIASRYSGAQEGSERFGFFVTVKGKDKGFLWTWMERVDPKKSKVENRDVLAISTQGLAAKDALLSSGHKAIFTEPHYNGFPAILVRLADITADELEPLIEEAWKSKATKQMLESWLDGTSSTE